MPPPWAAELPEMVQPTTVVGFLVKMAPPAAAAEFFDSVQPLTVRLGPVLKMAPPEPFGAALPDTVQLLTVRFTKFSMAPPPRPSRATPLVIVRPLRVTLMPLDCVWPTWNTRKAE